MKILPSILCSLVLVAPAVVSAADLRLEAGASYFVPRHGRFEQSSTPLTVGDSNRGAPFVAVASSLSENFNLRFSYHYISDFRATTQLSSPPGSPLTVIVWGHYRDDVHLVSAEPEFTWKLAPALTFAIAPQLNWVASRGTVSYTANPSALPTLLLVAPRDRRDDGFTLGAGARLIWSLGSRSAFTLGYRYVDLKPSFDREAHVFTGGLQWKF